MDEKYIDICPHDYKKNAIGDLECCRCHQVHPSLWARRTEKEKSPEAVNHPKHYGGENNPCEPIKVIEAWDLGFHLGNVVKYVARAGKKGNTLEDLKKARWYLDREIQRLE